MSVIDDYIMQFDGEIKERLIAIRNTIKAAAPTAVEKISYQMPAFYLNENLVYFAAFKNHIGFFPTAIGVEAFKDKLTEFKTTKGTIQFPNNKPLPLELITEITKHRVAQAIAEKAHRGQKDKVGEKYILHPIKVSEYCVSPKAKITALLHDVVEDSTTTLEDLLLAGIDKEIVTAVDNLTKRNGEEIDSYFKRISADDIAIEVKFADMRHNSDESRWPVEKKNKAGDNAYKYWRRMEQLYNLIGEERIKEILSAEMLAFIKDCILESYQ